MMRRVNAQTGKKPQVGYESGFSRPFQSRVKLIRRCLLTFGFSSLSSSQSQLQSSSSSSSSSSLFSFSRGRKPCQYKNHYTVNITDCIVLNNTIFNYGLPFSLAISPKIRNNTSNFLFMFDRSPCFQCVSANYYLKIIK